MSSKSEMQGGMSYLGMFHPVDVTIAIIFVASFYFFNVSQRLSSHPLVCSPDAHREDRGKVCSQELNSGVPHGQ